MQAMAEGHVWFEPSTGSIESSDASVSNGGSDGSGGRGGSGGGLIYVFHTVRWDRPNAPPPSGGPYSKDPFAPDGRNAEDLGVSVLSASPAFELDVPLIAPHWRLSLGGANGAKGTRRVESRVEGESTQSVDHNKGCAAV